MSIYDELNGSNDWNGSVLAAILLAGSAGAMLPSWWPSAVGLKAADSGSDDDSKLLKPLSGSSSGRQSTSDDLEVTQNALKTSE